MLIKVCGMREPENIRDVAALQPDMMGFIFYPSSARYAGNLAPSETTCPGIRKVGVFVNEQRERSLQLALRYRLDAVQLHGEETPEACRFLRNRGLQVIKALGIESPSDFLRTSAYEAVCDLFVFDTKTTSYGGSGRCFDWSLLEEYKGTVPFLLSGGLALEHAAQLKRITHPRFVGVDVNSRFELAPGLKDCETLSRFLQILRS